MSSTPKAERKGNLVDFYKSNNLLRIEEPFEPEIMHTTGYGGIGKITARDGGTIASTIHIVEGGVRAPDAHAAQVTITSLKAGTIFPIPQNTGIKSRAPIKANHDLGLVVNSSEHRRVLLQMELPLWLDAVFSARQGR